MGSQDLSLLVLNPPPLLSPSCPRLVNPTQLLPSWKLLQLSTVTSSLLSLTKCRVSSSPSRLPSSRTPPTSRPPKLPSSDSSTTSHRPLRCSPPLMPPPLPTSNKLNPNSPLKRDSSKNNRPKKLLPEPVLLLRRNSALFGKPTIKLPRLPELPRDRLSRKFNKFSLRDSRACLLTSKRELIMTSDLSLCDLSLQSSISVEIIPKKKK